MTVEIRPPSTHPRPDGLRPGVGRQTDGTPPARETTTSENTREALDDQSPMAVPGYTDIARVVREDLCHRCGVCGGICPQQAIEFDRRALPRITSACNDCGLCARVCSGLSYQAPESEPYGPHGRCFLCASTDPTARRAAASGGLVTELLCYLIRTGEIQGALVTETDPRDPSRPRAVLATSVERIRSARQSKYCLFPWGMALTSVLRAGRPFAAVGLACHIQSLRRAAALLPRLRRNLRLAVGLCCETNVEPEGIDHLLRLRRILPSRLEGIDFRSGAWPGVMVANLVGGDSRQLSNRTGDRGADYTSINWLKITYGQRRCRLCPDVTNAAADVTVGDPWVRSGPRGYYREEGGPGWTVAAVRSPRALEYLSAMQTAGRIHCRSQAPEPLFSLQIGQALQGRRRLQRHVRRARPAGRPYVHGYPTLDCGPIAAATDSLPTLRDLPLFRVPLFRRIFLAIMFSNLGDWLTRLNGWRRRTAWKLRSRFGCRRHCQL